MRVQVSLSDEMVQCVDFYAKRMGVSRSALCSMLIGQGVMTFDNLMNDEIKTKLKKGKNRKAQA